MDFSTVSVPLNKFVEPINFAVHIVDNSYINKKI